ncbi:MAG: GntR family transcriptional regulator [Rhodomicrobium sp.]|nr:GntR family transcriptional regulator [Rhodomicrobium sp.]
MTGGQAGSSLLHMGAEENEMNSISRRHLHDELLTRLRDCIIEGELQAGAKIPEKDLCERFGVSRTPLREALKVLAYEGLVILNHNRGSVVKPLSLQDLRHAFPIYGQLEALAGEIACERLGDRELDEIRTLHDRMVTHYKKRDVKGHVAINELIHEKLQIGSGNRNLIQLIRGVSTRIRRARMALIVPVTRLPAAIAEHEQIMTALERREPVQVSRAIRQHIENSFRAIRDTFVEQKDVPARPESAALERRKRPDRFNILSPLAMLVPSSSLEGAGQAMPAPRKAEMLSLSERSELKPHGVSRYGAALSGHRTGFQIRAHSGAP